MPISDRKLELIRKISSAPDLRTYDPYDIWKTRPGYSLKQFFNNHRRLALPAAAAFALFDTYINNRMRVGYTRQNYPIVYSLAALSLLGLYELREDTSLLASVESHLRWLVDNSCRGYSGPCWGLAFPYAVHKDFVYGVNTPLTTMTPYALEAFVIYTKITGEETFIPTIRGISKFFEEDIKVMKETESCLATSYSDIRDRIVINAVSYVMYSLALLLHYEDCEERRFSSSRKIRKLFEFIKANQREDGSWLYSPEGDSFIDCFHSCIVVKNILKTRKLLALDGADEIVESGYCYIKNQMRDAESGLYKRFAISNKPGLIKFDLYDNAEMLGLSCLVGDRDLARELDELINIHFVCDGNIYSHIDALGIRHNKNMLRWAVMPYLNSLTLFEKLMS